MFKIINKSVIKIYKENQSIGIVWGIKNYSENDFSLTN